MNTFFSKPLRKSELLSFFSLELQELILASHRQAISLHCSPCLRRQLNMGLVLWFDFTGVLNIIMHSSSLYT